MNRKPVSKNLRLLFSMITTLTLAPVFAQSPELDELDDHVTAIKALFQQMDATAEGCLDDSGQSCQVFLDALDSHLDQYQQHCQVLRDWRDQLVEENTATTAVPETGTARRLIDVEYTCGEDALVKRTAFVLAAYEKTQSGNRTILPAVVADANQQQTQNEYARLRRSLLRDSSAQRQRLDDEIQQQWQRIELENLREQNRRPVDFGTFPPVNPQ